MTGLEWPRPGISTFHATFFVSLHSVGALPGATPVCAGPRQWGHHASAGALPRWAASVADAITMAMITLAREACRIVRARRACS
jgi:hypothetical protein